MRQTDKERLVDLAMLAKFANLESSQEAEHFRQAVAPKFLPEKFWKGWVGWIPATGTSAPPLWQMEQDRLREAWRKGFPPNECVHLISTVARFTRLEMFLENAERKSAEELANSPIMQPEAFPYQRCIMWLHQEPWRARTCELCGKFYIKRHQAERFCSDDCTRKNLLQSKRKSWNRHKHQWR